MARLAVALAAPLSQPHFSQQKMKYWVVNRSSPTQNLKNKINNLLKKRLPIVLVGLKKEEVEVMMNLHNDRVKL